jgi:MFS transporter, ACS family, hexuronate transporter
MIRRHSPAKARAGVATPVDNMFVDLARLIKLAPSVGRGGQQTDHARSTGWQRKYISMEIGKKRWLIFVLLMLANVVNYVDRQALSILAPVMHRELGLSNVDYSFIVNAFLVAYALSYLGSGYMVDRLGGRIGVALCVAVWSIAATLHAATVGFLSLMTFRFLLGLSESGINPGAVKILTRLFSPRDRAFTIGMVFGGAGIGAVFAPVVIVWLLLHANWRVAFLITGLLGFAVLLAWFIVYRPSDDDPSDLPAFENEAHVHALPYRWKDLFRLRATWIIILLHSVAGPVFFFFMFWLPNYLAQSRGFSMELIGKTTWIPYLGEFLGLLVGSLVAGRLIKSGFGALWTRKAVGLACAVIVPLSVLASLQVSNPYEIVILMAFAMFGIGMQISSFAPLPGDLFPYGNVASVTGVAGLSGSAAGVVFTFLVGFLADKGLYVVPFWIVAAAYPLGMLIFAVFLKPIPPNRTAAEFVSSNRGPVPATVRNG